MGRPRHFQLPPTPAPEPVRPVVEPLPFSFDLPGAAKYLSISDEVIRAAVHSGELLVVLDKPITITRSDLERWVESRRHRYQKPVLKKQKS